jgi:hypothetical protein
MLMSLKVISAGEISTVLGLDVNGLGSPTQTLSSDQLIRFQQYSYSADILYVLNLGLTDISVLLLIYSLTPVTIKKTATLLAIGFTTLWTISSLITLLFQCHLPHPWQFIDNQCIDTVGFCDFSIERC